LRIFPFHRIADLRNKRTARRGWLVIYIVPIFPLICVGGQFRPLLAALHGTLDNEPVNDYDGKIELGSELAVSYSQIREHKKPTEFTKQ
jgi:hypothetical protein